MSNIYTIIEANGKPVTVTIECKLSNSLPAIVIVGAANRTIHEAKERIRAALHSSKIPIPRKRITINLAPADTQKSGSSLDVAMLVSVLIHVIPPLNLHVKTAIIGELGLDGSIKPVRGIIGKILAAKQLGFEAVWIPVDNTAQAQLIAGIKIYPFASVSELAACMQTNLLPDPVATINSPNTQSPLDSFDTIVGHSSVKRALAIAVAGSHNMLMTGPPGSGKSMLAKASPEIAPDLDITESQSATHLHSLSNPDFNKVITRPPFRAPHHGASKTRIIGGGSPPQPGEISLSHNGILFMDEFLEFNAIVLEALRQPLEEQVITTGRANQYCTFPAKFQLIAATNPCPCGYLYSSRTCICTPGTIARYRRKLSGAILDRIDMHITVDSVDHSQPMSNTRQPTTQHMRKQVLKARASQLTRSGKLNSQLTMQELLYSSDLKPTSLQLLHRANKTLHMSSRGYIRTLRIARTIADYAGMKSIEPTHISESLQYRSTTP